MPWSAMIADQKLQERAHMHFTQMSSHANVIDKISIWRILNRYWVHHINKKRSKHGEFASMFKQLVKYPERFHSYFRMTKEQFYALLNLIKSKIQPRICKFRKPISAIEKLVVTLK